MSLHEAADGILETSVTWADFERNLRSALSSEARFGASKAVVNIGEGKGFVSRCGLVTCDWVGVTEDELLPTKVVLKIPSALPFRKLNDALPAGQKLFEVDEATLEIFDIKIREVHNIEVATYEFFEEFTGLSIPIMYYGKSFRPEDKIGGQICLEYIENSRIMNMYEKHSVEQVRQIAVALGNLQACSLNKGTTSPELLNYCFDDYTNHHKTVEAFISIFKGISAIDTSENARKLMDEINKFLPEYFGTNLPSTLHKQMGFRPVLVNGDLRTENVLIDKDSGDLAALIDWQCTHFGVGVEDLLRIALFALPAEERRASMPMLVEEMYKSLVENLDGSDPPYSLDTLLQLSDLLFPHCALFYASGCVALITNQQRDASISDEEKTDRKDVELDKLIGALEDIVRLHEKNKGQAANLKFRDS